MTPPKNKPAEADEPEALTLAQAGAQLGGISAKTVRRLIADQVLPAAKLPRIGWRIRPADLAEFIARNITPAHNRTGAGQASTQETGPCHSAEKETKTGYTSGQTRRTGGPAGRTEAAARLAARLGLG